MNDRLARLAPYIPAPTRQNKVLEFVRAAGRPVILREVAEGLGIDKVKLTTPLARLCDRGELVREKIVLTYPHGRWGGTQKVRAWLYRAASNDESCGHEGTTMLDAG